MKLYNYFRSSASFRVRIALHLKGLPFEYIPIHLVKGEQSQEPFASISPAQLVPLLEVDDGHSLTQSLAIIEYLDETHPQPPLLPADPLGRARVRALSQDIACEIHPLNNLRVLRYLVRQLGVDEEAKNAWYRHWVETGLQAVERQLAGSPATGSYCHGDSPTHGRLRARAAGLQCPALRMPARRDAHGDAHLRALHEARSLRESRTLQLPRRAGLNRC